MRFTDALHDPEHGSFDDANSDQNKTRCVSPEDGQKNASQTILLVEDNAFVRSVISEVLDSAGFQLWPARNGLEALQIARTCKSIDLLITDVVMPGMNGRDLAIRFENLYPRAKVLLISGYPKKLQENSPNIRFENLAKPFSAKMLLQRVHEILALKYLEILY